MTGKLLGLYIFGSVARGENDERSDLDLLAVVADGQGKVPEQDVLALVPPALQNLEPSISWYGRDRLKGMFDNGELFGWHLYAETIPLFEQGPIFAELGCPAPYRGALEDVISFKSIMAGVPHQLAMAPENATYELGLIYVCLRNICMSASSALCGKPDFSRYSPFNLIGFCPAPIDQSEYELAMACRMAGQRGFLLPSPIDPNRVQQLHSRLSPWVAELIECLEGD